MASPLSSAQGPPLTPVSGFYVRNRRMAGAEPGEEPGAADAPLQTAQGLRKDTPPSSRHKSCYFQLPTILRVETTERPVTLTLTSTLARPFCEHTSSPKAMCTGVGVGVGGEGVGEEEEEEKVCVLRRSSGPGRGSSSSSSLLWVVAHGWISGYGPLADWERAGGRYEEVGVAGHISSVFKV